MKPPPRYSTSDLCWSSRWKRHPVPTVRGERIYKQLYVNASRPSKRYTRLFFERALSAYLKTYRLDDANQGISVLASARRSNWS